MCHKLIKEVECALRLTGLRWEIEDGKKHRIVRIEGFKICVFSVAAGKDVENVKREIKRFCRK